MSVVRSVAIAIACVALAAVICLQWREHWRDATHCVTLPGDWSFVRPRPVAERYFTSPELSAKSALAFWEDNQIHPVCIASRQLEHQLNASTFARRLDALHEADLRRSSGRVVRIMVVGSLVYKDDLFTVTYNAQGATVRSSRRVWSPPDWWPAQAMTHEQFVEAHDPSRYREVVAERTISPRRAEEFWALQRSIQPIPEGYYGWTDGTAMLIESMDHRFRDARYVLMSMTPGTDYLGCYIEGLALAQTDWDEECGGPR